MNQDLGPVENWNPVMNTEFVTDDVNGPLCTENLPGIFDTEALSPSNLDEKIKSFELKLAQLKQRDEETSRGKDECYIQLGTLHTHRKSIGALSTSNLDGKIKACELELSQLQQRDDQTATERRECYVQLARLCNLRKARKATVPLSDLVPFDNQSHVGVIDLFQFDDELGLAQPQQPPDSPSDLCIGTSQGIYFNPTGTSEPEIASFDFSTIPDPNILPHTFTQLEDLPWRLESFRYTGEEPFKNSITCHPTTIDTTEGFTSGDSQIRDQPSSGSLEGLLPSAYINSDICTLPSLIPHDESDQSLENCYSTLGKVNGAHGKTILDQESVVERTLEGQSSNVEINSITTVGSRVDVSLLSDSTKPVSSLNCFSGRPKRPLSEPEFPGCLSFSFGPEPTVQNKMRRKLTVKERQNSKRVKQEGGACWTCRYSRIRCSPGEPCEPCMKNASKLPAALEDACCRMTLSELNIFAQDAVMPWGALVAPSYKNKAEIFLTSCGQFLSWQQPLVGVWDIRVFKTWSDPVISPDAGSLLRQFSRRLSIVEDRELRRLQNPHVTTSVNVLAILDRILQPNKLKSFLKAASEVEALKLIFCLSLIFRWTFAEDQLQTSQDLERKRFLLRATIRKHIRHIWHQKLLSIPEHNHLTIFLRRNEPAENDLCFVLFSVYLENPNLWVN